MLLTELKIYLEQEILKNEIIKIKRFGKGQVFSCYVKLKNGTELTVKFYKNKSDLLYAYNVALGLEQIPELRVLRLFHMQNKFFLYKTYYGLCFYYIQGKEISANKISKFNLQEIIEAYTKFSNSILWNFELRKDISIEESLETLQKSFLELQYVSNNILKKYLFSIVCALCNHFINSVKERYSSRINVPLKLIHCDITKSNMLFLNGHFKSFIDTDSMCYSYVGRDFAEFIISTVLHYPFYKNRRIFIREWYKLIEERFHLSYEEYIYGLDIYYLYRIKCRLIQYEKKITLCKLWNFLEFLKLHQTVMQEIKKVKENV